MIDYFYFLYSRIFMFAEGDVFINTAEDCGLTRLFETETAKLEAINNKINELKAYDDEISKLETKKAEIIEAKELLEKYYAELYKWKDYVINKQTKCKLRNLKDLNIFCYTSSVMFDDLDYDKGCLNLIKSYKPPGYSWDYKKGYHYILKTKDEVMEECKSKFKECIKSKFYDKSNKSFLDNYEKHMKEFITFEQFYMLTEETIMMKGIDVRRSGYNRLFLEKSNVFNNVIKPTLNENNIEKFYQNFQHAFTGDIPEHSSNNMYSFSLCRHREIWKILETVERMSENEFDKDCRIYTQILNSTCCGPIEDLTFGIHIEDALCSDKRFKTNPILKTLNPEVFIAHRLKRNKYGKQLKEFESEVVGIDNYINELKQNMKELVEQRDKFKQIQHHQDCIIELKQQISNETRTHDKMLLTSRLIVELDDLRKLIK